MRNLNISIHGERVQVTLPSSRGPLWALLVVGGAVLLLTATGASKTLLAAGAADTVFYFACFACCFAGVAITLLVGRRVLPGRYEFHNDRRLVELVGRDGTTVSAPFELFWGFGVTEVMLQGSHPSSSVRRGYQVNLFRCDGGVWMLGGYTDKGRADANVALLAAHVRIGPQQPAPHDSPAVATLRKKAPKLSIEETATATTFRWRPTMGVLNTIGGTLLLGGFATLFVSALVSNVQYAVMAAGAIVVSMWLYTVVKYARSMALEVTAQHVRAYLPKSNRDLFRIELRSVGCVVSIFGNSENSTELYVLTPEQQQQLVAKQKAGRPIVMTTRSITDGQAINTFEMTVPECVHFERCLAGAVARQRAAAAT